jgi:hypothetical protein
MEFLIVFGGILTLIALTARQFIQWEVDPNACNMEQEIKNVKMNRIVYRALIIGGPIMMAIGILSLVL